MKNALEIYYTRCPHCGYIFYVGVQGGLVMCPGCDMISQVTVPSKGLPPGIMVDIRDGKAFGYDIRTREPRELGYPILGNLPLDIEGLQTKDDFKGSEDIGGPPSHSHGES